MGDLGWEDPLEKGKATHSSILAWRIPWGRKESDTIEQLSLLLKYFRMSHYFPLYYFTLAEFILNSREVKFVSILKLLVLLLKYSFTFIVIFTLFLHFTFCL